MNEFSDKWWGELTIEVGSTAQWEIGPLRIAVQRQQREWLVAQEHFEPEEDPQELRFAVSEMDLNENESSDVTRIVCQSTGEQLTVRPALADRSVISRPFTPFTVLANEHATIYVSTPLWFTLATGPSTPAMFETPIQRLSDTWFGPSTQEGETCYASRTYARLNLENLTNYTYRAITQVDIHNNSTSPLLIERLNLPVPYLSLFYASESILWTETVTFIQKRGTSLAEFDIDKGLPAPAADAQLVATPRQNPEKGMLIRAFGVLRLQGFD